MGPVVVELRAAPLSASGCWPQWVGCRRLSAGGSGVPNWLLATRWLVLTPTYAGGNSMSSWPADPAATAPGPHKACQLSNDLTSTAPTRSVVPQGSLGPPPTTRAWSRSLVFFLRWPRPRPPMSEAAVSLGGITASPKPIGAIFFPLQRYNTNSCHSGSNNGTKIHGFRGPQSSAQEAPIR